MDSYRFVISRPDITWRPEDTDVPQNYAQETIELRVGDEFYLPNISALWYAVLSIDLSRYTMTYAPCGSENDLELRMSLGQFAEDFQICGAINRDEINIYSNANTPNRTNEPVPPRTVNIADEEHYWSPEESGINRNMLIYGDTHAGNTRDINSGDIPDNAVIQPLEEETFIYGATRILENNVNAWGEAFYTSPLNNALRNPYIVEATTADNDHDGLYVSDYIIAWNEAVGELKLVKEADKEEPIELSKEVWVF